MVRSLLGALSVSVASLALFYYSYRYASEMARRGEQSIVETTKDLAEGEINRIETLIKENNEQVLGFVDLDHLQNLTHDVRAQTVASVIVLDDKFRIVPDGFVTTRPTKADADAFRKLFESEIVNDLALPTLSDQEVRWVHREWSDVYHLFSTTRRQASGRSYYIVIETDCTHLISNVFPDYFANIDSKRVYTILDEHDKLVFGHRFTGVPAKYLTTSEFQFTLTAWRLRMAPREAPTLAARERTRQVFDLVLIILSAVTLLVGIVILISAARAERIANEAKSDFIANVSHELKTPLSLIRMFGELLATGRTKGPEQGKEYAEIITRESERLSRLIDNVLDFARIERGKAAYEFAEGDLAEVLSRGLDVYRWRLDREGMKLIVEIEPNLPIVKLDENAMTLVLLNLVDNAVKYAADGKELTVTVTRDASRVLLKVTDRGPGISPDERERIFERFYRSHAVRGKPVRGSGIGLSLVKHIAEAHGGGVGVEPASPGSTFTVWLPILREADAEMAAS